MKNAARSLLAALLALCSFHAYSQAPWPSKPIRYIVPFAAGGTTDVLGRLLGPRISEAIGQPIVIENRPGAGGNVGSDVLAKSPADGYTIGGGTVSSHAINASMYAKMPYDNIRDFAPIALIVTVPNVLAVHPSVPAKNLAEFIGYAKANPGRISFASAGNGTSQHLSGELFKTLAGVDMVHVPYKGSGPATADLVAGQVLAAFENATIIVPYVKSGRVRALGVTPSMRTASLPEVPTIAEAGLPGYEVSSWQGMFAPAGTPRDIVARLNTEVRRILAQPEMRQKLLDVGSDPADMSPEQFAAFIRSETAKWAPVVKASGARVE